MKVVINNLEWDVSFVEKHEIDECFGRTKFSDLEIKIATSFHRDVIRTTITHEVVHAFIESMGIVPPSSDSQMLFSEEQVCDFVGMNLDEIAKTSKTIYLYYLGKYVYNKDEDKKEGEL